ncbi:MULTISPECIES: hypothetical protein [Kitasatospora]|uniref:Uncharacterized protein n=1 Tax=Kitasatospora setae (strain ATCC 33774 / DSM 43861 / JCM 3304 / KCC A-0304 / NBRC 14216 / KM-6054) TaxID=452652 RepID=E4NJC1_KITSK|nr:MULTISPECIES: hypothetical protein [Kitasatospora]BAJ33069.1 hypothetical protein KSE_73140 [Kitasatospora setae KM-6054]
MAGTEDGRSPVLQECPTCGLDDEVVGVPAAYHAGRDTVRDGEEGGVRTVSSSLSSALAPAPTRLPRATSCLMVVVGLHLVAVSIGTFVAGALAGHWFDGGDPVPDGPDPYGGRFHGTVLHPADAASADRPSLLFLGWISGAALLLAVALFVAVRRRARAGRRQAARQADRRAEAERLWSRGWYCRRCGTVHFRAEPGCPARALTLGDFRREVWAAGGYGDPAESADRPGVRS